MANQVVTVSIYKSYGGRSATGQWVNRYNVNVPDLTDSIPDVVNKLVAFEKAMHRTDVNFMRCTVSLNNNHGHSGNNADFFTSELTGTGADNRAGDTSPLDVCMVVKLSCASGRSGRSLYRGCLLNSDYDNGPGGRPVLGAGSAEPQLAEITAWNGDATRPTIVIAKHGDVNPADARTVTTWNYDGIAVIKAKRAKKKPRGTGTASSLKSLGKIAVDAIVDLIGDFAIMKTGVVPEELKGAAIAALPIAEQAISAVLAAL